MKKKTKNIYICHAPYLRNSIAYDHDFWWACVKWWYLLAFFSFFKILKFQIVGSVKGQKMAQNEKKVCLSCFISQESFIIWSSFMIHMCNRIIYTGLCYIYSRFLFLGSIVGKNDKGWPKITKIHVCYTSYLRKYTSYDHNFW